eukprot:gb/GECG01000005.1/.p1 GENE.gb/GECG01000005.1/~~gb/GECG01000005.1/.p1  ORF type:complete len:343 (+),score=16.65 gb/GECG01000005.1/:1-1029(+)
MGIPLPRTTQMFMMGAALLGATCMSLWSMPVSTGQATAKDQLSQRLHNCSQRRDASEMPHRESIAVIVSGLDTRLLKSAVDSLVDHVVRPQVAAGYTVHIFAVLQRQRFTSFLRDVDKSAWNISSDENRIIAQSMYLSTRIRKAGGVLRTFQREFAPTFSQLRLRYSLRSTTRLGNGRKQQLWERNIAMYHNMLRGFEEAKSRQDYSMYVRTRSDNVFFRKHPPYSHFSEGEAIVPACRRYGGYNDKFHILKSIRAAAAVFEVLLDNDLINSDYKNSERMWAASFKRFGVDVRSFDPRSISIAHVSMSSARRPCYRSYRGCVTEDIMRTISRHHRQCVYDNK